MMARRVLSVPLQRDFQLFRLFSRHDSLHLCPLSESTRSPVQMYFSKFGYDSGVAIIMAELCSTIEGNVVSFFTCHSRHFSSEIPPYWTRSIVIGTSILLKIAPTMQLNE